MPALEAHLLRNVLTQAHGALRNIPAAAQQDDTLSTP
jgi:hypothetical protein